MAFLFIVPHAEECNDHNEPIEVVRKDTSVCRRVLPAEDGVENAPTAATVELRVAAVNMPNTFVDVI